MNNALVPILHRFCIKIDLDALPKSAVVPGKTRTIHHNGPFLAHAASARATNFLTDTGLTGRSTGTGSVLPSRHIKIQWVVPHCRHVTLPRNCLQLLNASIPVMAVLIT
jgi:hypothetical protein